MFCCAVWIHHAYTPYSASPLSKKSKHNTAHFPRAVKLYDKSYDKSYDKAGLTLRDVGGRMAPVTGDQTDGIIVLNGKLVSRYTEFYKLCI